MVLHGQYLLRVRVSGVAELKTAAQKTCHCANGWICEEHPHGPWPHDDCAGPGELCANPDCVVGRITRAELEARRAVDPEPN